MVLSRLLGPKRMARPAEVLSRAVVAQSRMEAFYGRLGVPDTLDGRFELVALHGFLLLRRLKGEGPRAAVLAQAVFDRLFADIDASLREMGVGDLGVGPRIKTMAKGFYGRISAYESGLAGDDAGLCEALARNLFATAPAEEATLRAMAGYLRREAASLADQPLAALSDGRLRFGPPPP